MTAATQSTTTTTSFDLLYLSFKRKLSTVLLSTDVVVLHEVERWSLGKDDAMVRHIGTFTSSKGVQCVIQTNENTLLTGVIGSNMLTEWDLTTYKATKTHPTDSPVTYMTKTKDSSSILCGLWNRSIELRRMSDLDLICQVYISFHVTGTFVLEDDSIVLAGMTGQMERWDKSLSRRITTFSSDYSTRYHTSLLKLMELNSDVIVTLCVNIMQMWKVSTGECFHTVEVSQTKTCNLYRRYVDAVKLSTDTFVSALIDGKIEVWNDQGDCLSTFDNIQGILKLIRFGDSIVAFSHQQISVLRWK